MFGKKKKQIRSERKGMTISKKTREYVTRPVRFIASLLSFSLCVVATTGCWDRREVNDVAIVIAMSMDRERDGMIRLGVQMPLVSNLGGPSGGGGGTSGDKAFYVDSAVGRTIREANAIIQRRMSRHIYYAHHRVVVIGEELAKNGVSEVLDIISRFPENRLTAYVVLAKGKGIELLTAQPQFERFSGEAIRELVKAGTIPVTIKDLSQNVSSIGLDPILPVLIPVDSQPKGDSKEIEMVGVGIFRGDKLVKIQDLSALSAMKWFQLAFTPFTYVLQMEDKTRVSLDIYEGRSFIQPVLKPGHVHFHIKVKGLAVVTENMTSLDVSDRRIIVELQKRLNEKVSHNIEGVLEQMKRSNADTLGLGIAVARHFPKLWKEKYRDRWKEELSTFTYDVESDVEVTNVGQTSRNIMKEGSE